MTLPNRITGPWSLKELPPSHGLKVFSCFHCGGGSTMGYKLAGYDVLGGVEIDPEMMEIYRRNHKPRLSFLEGVQDFAKRTELPQELFGLDILDGSPPCSSFSTSGARHRLWGKEKKFREGQAVQVLDDLFFDFIAVAKLLKPRVVVAENVKALMHGKAKFYVKEIFRHFNEAGYDAQLFLLNASRMGVPQARERTFFIARRKDLGLAPLKLEFNEDPIALAAAIADLPEDKSELPSDASTRRRWHEAPIGGQPLSPGGGNFGFVHKADPNRPAPTITASQRVYHWSICRNLNKGEVIRAQSFPEDYDFMKEGDKFATYVCGMSVPPFMMQRVALEIARQWLLK